MTSRHDPADQKDNDKEQWPVHCSARGAPGKNPAIIQSLERPFFVRLCEVFLLTFLAPGTGVLWPGALEMKCPQYET